ncbi:MAG: sulfatase [Alkalispirochaeta sp.]
MSDRRSPEKNRPSVLFLVSHDLGPQHGCYGGPAVTPHQDALAEQGLRFDRHYVHYPLCGPSRANLFTGCRPLTTERFNNQPFMPGFRERMGEGFRTLPEHFRRAGYRTRGFGLIFHDVDDAPSWEEPIWRAPPQNSVADAHRYLPPTLTSGDNKDWATDGAYELIRERWQALQATGFTEADLKKNPSVARKAQGPPVEAAEVDDKGYEDGGVTDAALEYLRSLAKDEPFFMAVGFVTGHTPFRAPKRYFDLYDRNSLPLPDFREPPEGSPEWASGDSEPSQYYTTDGYELPWKATEEQSRELLHGHLAATSYIDAQIGRLISELKERGRYEDTIVVAISDHGFHDGQHGYWGKHNLWEHSLRAPFILRLPRTVPLPRRVGEATKAGDIVAGITEHVDVFPTLCDLCGLAKPEHLEGRSMLRQILDPAGPGGRATFAHRKHMWHDRIKAYEVAHTVRTERYHYTEYRNQQDTAIYRELFDYENDPDERLNYISMEEYRGIAEEMKNLLDDYLAAPRRFSQD